MLASASVVVLAGCGSRGGDCAGIVAPVRTLAATPAAVSLETDGRARVATTLSGGCSGDPQAVSWASADERIATVAGDGTVTGVGPGSTTLTATAFDGVTRTTVPVSVRIRRIPLRVVATPRTHAMAPGETRGFAAVVTDQLDGVVDGAPLAWRSLEPGIAAVNSAGTVAGVTAGTARIVVSTGATAPGDSLRDTVVVTVTAPPAPTPPAPTPPTPTPPTPTPPSPTPPVDGCTFVRPVAVPGSYTGQLGTSSCRTRFGLAVVDLFRFEAGGGALAALVQLEPRSAMTLVPLSTAGAAAALAVGANARGAAIVVLPAGRAADATTGFAVGAAALPTGDGSYRLTLALDPDPARECVPTFTVRGVVFDSWLSDSPCRTRDVVLVPPVAAGGRLRASIAVERMRVRLELVDRATGAVLATATTDRDGDAAIDWRASGATSVTLRLVRENMSGARVRVTID